jgi:pimeloyl-ACP methyl ester carboxylesterase
MKKSILGLLLLVAGVALACHKADDDAAPDKTKATVVLVHGSWQGAFAWAPVKTSLEQKGYTVVNVELPAHGDDQTPAAGLTLLSYRDKVAAAINAQKASQVILVGHSLGGMVISAVAEQMPAKVSKLVYVAGFLPQNQQSALDLAQQDAQSLLGPALSFSPDNSLALVNQSQIVNIFCQDGTAAVQQQVLAKYRPEPASPVAEKLALTAANFGRVPKYYVRTLQDHAVSPGLQDIMLRATPVQREYRIDSGHTPHLTRPDELSTLLAEIIQL